MKGAFSGWLMLAALAGCATPVVMMKNESTGQVARCGGGVTGSIAGGLIGHNIEKAHDEDCVRDFEARGFRRISSSTPQTDVKSSPKPQATASNPTATGANSHQIERTPEARACATQPVANLASKSPGVEIYTVACANGDALTVRCEYSTCRVLK